jgi:hypothetical protein
MRLIKWLKTWWRYWWLKEKVETGTVETDPGPTVIKYSPPPSERKARIAERRYRKLNDKTKGAYGRPKATPHYSSMKRNRDV